MSARVCIAYRTRLSPPSFAKALRSMSNSRCTSDKGEGPSKSPLLPTSESYFSLHNRTQSILLDPLNPITHPNAHVKSKPEWKPREQPIDEQNPTSMNEKLWANPYARMLSSPMRKCALTGQRLPSDFLLRFSAATIDADTATLDLPKKISPTFLLPDGLLHPRFQALSGGSGWYILCWKDAVEEFGSRGQHKRVHPTAHFHSLLASQITDHLRLRVLQEMELLGNRIEALPRNVQSTHVRRLSLDEWMDMKEGRWVPESSTLAVLVVPKVRPPREMMSDDPGSNMSKSPKEVHPLCNLYQSAAPPPNAPLLPIYSGYALFPNRDQRTACRQALSRLITIERKRRWRGRVFPSAPKDGGGGRARASDAFLFKADLGTASRVDVVPLVIALWRLRLWEGEGWSK